ncbi:uncharacterized protein [Oryctolagus cuniculus]|uniref:uncharacterized protein isoform X8 n=1 Tax=Oryctolagus cuniculus TaxID=9986 RepID=UPI003879A5F9
MWGRSRQVGGTGLPRRVPWTMWLSSQWAPVCRACIQLSHFSCCAGHQCQMCLVVSLCLSMGSRLSIGSAGTRWGNEAGSKSSRDVGAKSGSRRPLDLGSLEDTWMPGWGWRIIPEGRGGELGGGCPSPPVPSPCALEESSSWDPATRYLLACLCGCPLRPWGQTSGQQFPWAPHAGSQVCVSYRLDMDTLRSGRAQERAVIIMKYEKGPRKGAQFQLGEEGEENGVLVPDRFGFLHKQKLPRHGWLAVQWRTLLGSRHPVSIPGVNIRRAADCKNGTRCCEISPSTTAARRCLDLRAPGDHWGQSWDGWCPSLCLSDTTVLS